MNEHTSSANIIAALPDSAPWPMVVYTLGVETHGVYEPTGTVPSDSSRSVVESELAMLADPRVHVIETTVMPWKPASQAIAGITLPVEFEYTVGFGTDGQYTTWGLSISQDRGEIEGELATVEASVADHRRHRGPVISASQFSLTPVLLERVISPWRKVDPPGTGRVESTD